MIISINRGTFNRRLTSAGALLAVFALSLLLIACPLREEAIQIY